MVISLYNQRRILLFPTGNRNQGAVSIFLENFECTQKDENEKFHVCAQFAIAILHPTDDSVYKSQGNALMGLNKARIIDLLHLVQTGDFLHLLNVRI
jgi:hypothetical protein